MRLIQGLLGPLQSRFRWLAAFSLINGSIEMAGVVSLYPFLMVASNPGMVQELPLLRRAYEGLGFGQISHFVAALGLLFVFLYLLTNLGNAAGEWLRYSFSSQFSLRLSRELLARYLYSPYAFLLSRNTGALLHHATGESNYAASLCNRMVETMIRVSVAVSVSVALLAVEPTAALATAGVIVLLYSQIYRFHDRRASRLGEERARLALESGQAAAHGLSALKESRAFPQRAALLERYEEPARRMVATAANLRAITVFPRYATEILAILCIVGVLVYLVLTGRGPQAVPSAGVFVLATWRLVPCLQDVYGNLIEMRAELPLLERVAENFHHAVPRLPDGEPGVLPLRDAIRVNRVSFTYPGTDRPAVADVSLELPRGSRTALVGRTGAGKTTLADLIGGFHSPDSGTVQVDDRHLSAECTLAWQRNLGYVPQSIALIDDSVLRNVALGEREPGLAAVRKACGRAQIAEFVESLPEGYETALGERGSRLSGGQRQRIGIARAFYREPEFLILDEATSSLDNLTERSVLETLEGPETVLVIAHRLSTVERCNQIVLLDEGRVVARGTYEELMRESPLFRELALSP